MHVCTWHASQMANWHKLRADVPWSQHWAALHCASASHNQQSRPRLHGHSARMHRSSPSKKQHPYHICPRQTPFLHPPSFHTSRTCRSKHSSPQHSSPSLSPQPTGAQLSLFASPWLAHKQAALTQPWRDQCQRHRQPSSRTPPTPSPRGAFHDTTVRLRIAPNTASAVATSLHLEYMETSAFCRYASPPKPAASARQCMARPWRRRRRPPQALAAKGKVRWSKSRIRE
ncbi:hypothetical protein C2845_PM12G22430 [Panicum miliaceum]|uniref:Uncharacterized protein n=1 Tax=Panicum miliaceum TaxID=4540 RepID=A0A3L6QEL6_PANMI|nr:hypothetical protein C2845_PM12G22430 [Panicum miliaceum]